MFGKWLNCVCGFQVFYEKKKVSCLVKKNVLSIVLDVFTNIRGTNVYLLEVRSHRIKLISANWFAHYNKVDSNVYKNMLIKYFALLTGIKMLGYVFLSFADIHTK